MAMEEKELSGGRATGFVGVAYAFLIVMLGTTLPTPLYPIYSDTFGLSDLMVTIIYATYALGVIGGLLVFGQLSDRIGRRYILIPGVLLSAVSALVFLFADGIALLFVGRVLSGLSAGLFTSTATATLVSMAPHDKQGKASMLASGVNMLGLGMGPLLAGIFAQYFPYPMRIVFAVDFAILIPAFIAIWLMPEPVKEKQKLRLKVQKLSVPPEVRATFIRAVIPAFAGFSVLGMFTAVSPAFLQDVLAFDNKAVLGVIVFSIFCASAISQALLKRTPDRTVLKLGTGILIFGTIFVSIALQLRSLTLVVTGAIVSGAGQGFSFRAGLASVNAKSPSRQRGEVTSSFFTLAYIALSIPVVGVGLLAKWTGIQVAGMVFSIVFAFVSLIALLLIFMRRDE